MSETASPKNGRKKILYAVGLLAVVGLASFIYWLIFMKGLVTTDDARFSADLVDIAPLVGGSISEILVSEGEVVKQGQVLYRIGSDSLKAANDQAAANAESARAGLAMAEANYQKSLSGPRRREIRMAEAAGERAASQAKLAEQEWDRAQELFGQGFIAASDYDRARTSWEVARHGHEEAAEHLQLLRDGARSEDLTAAEQSVELAKAQLSAAEANVRRAQVSLDDAEVKAPFGGIVVKVWSEAGAFVSPGKPVLSLLNPATLYVAANIEEKYLHLISIGDKVEVAVDAFPSLTLTGKVATIIRAANSEFSLIPSEGVSGAYIKVSQRVPLRIELDNIPDLPLGPGLSAEVSIAAGSSASPNFLAQADGTATR